MVKSCLPSVAFQILRLGLIIMTVGVSTYGVEQVKPPEFSVGRGLYAAPVTIVLSSPTPGATIRYTTDSTWPTATAGTLGSSLTVSSTKVVRAIACLDGMDPSPVVTHTYIFVDEIARQPKNAQGSPTLGTQSFSYGYVGSTEMNKTFVDSNLANVKAGLRAIPSLCLSGDPWVLFGDGGITRFGTLQLDSFMAQEVRTSFEIIFPDGRPGTQIDNGLKMAGQSSGWRPKKPMAIEFRDLYGSGRLQFPLLPTSPARRFDELRLRNSWWKNSS